MVRKNTLSRRLMVLLTLGALTGTMGIGGVTGMAGCYRHVVSATGPNEDAYDLHKPNNPNQKAVPADKRSYSVPNQGRR